MVHPIRIGYLLSFSEYGSLPISVQSELLESPQLATRARRNGKSMTISLVNIKKWTPVVHPMVFTT